MAEDFYTQWLGVPPGQRPPDHYTLLGVERFCQDLDAVERAARAQLRRLDEYALHPDWDTRDAVQDMMNEVARARMCLVHPEKRGAYDEELAAKLGVAVPGAADRAEQPLAAEDGAARFEELVWSHLRKWRLNAQEERLLLAEAENLGVDGTIARQIIARVDAEAERGAARRRQRWTHGLVGVAAAAVVGLLLTALVPAWIDAMREGRFAGHLSAAERHLREEDFEAALAELARAEEVLPGDARVSSVRSGVAGRVFEAVRRHIDGSDHREARELLGFARRYVPGDAELAALSARLAKAEQLRFDGCLSEARRLFGSGAYQAALAQAEAALGIRPADASAGTLKERIEAKLGFYSRWPFDAAQASRRRSQAAAILGVEGELTLDLGRDVAMELALIPAGRFVMGSPIEEADRGSDEGPQHEVTIVSPFYMGIHEVTREQYEAVMDATPGRFEGRTNPVENVSWDDAALFCRKLAARAGRAVRLPTEAEWEYACRAGTSTPFHTGETIGTDQANYNGEATYASGARGVDRGKTIPVGGLSANAWGLYDMHGNVYEWCQDWYDGRSYAEAGARDPRGPSSGTYRVLRGGSWRFGPHNCRSAYRHRHSPYERRDYIGFRVVAAVGGPP